MSTAPATTGPTHAGSMNQHEHAAEVVGRSAPPQRTRTGSNRCARRILGAVIAVGCGVILGLAAWMTPAADGHGTHKQLNLPPCGWILAADIPCPTCGMTTAFAHAADGNLLQSMLTQPLGAVLALATAMGLFISSYVAMTGSRVGNVLAGMWTRKVTYAVIAAVILAWGFKILSHKGLL